MEQFFLKKRYYCYKCPTLLTSNILTLNDILSVFQSFYSSLYLRLDFTVVRTELDETCFFEKESGRLSAKRDTHDGEEKAPEKERPGYKSSVQFSSVQSLSHVRLFAIPWIAARQASLSITNSQSSLRLTSIESVMPSSHRILCRPLLLLPPIPPSISHSSVIHKAKW